MTGELSSDRLRALAELDDAFTSFAAGGRAGRLHQRMGAAAGELGHAGFPMLAWLAAWAPVRVTELAERSGLDASTVSRRVADLQDKGLITRAVDLEDQRASLLELTPRGAQLLADLREARRRLLDDALSDWPAGEVQALAGMLRRLTEAFDRLL
jgi:DNA-binding MarR family transcriptional regulator